MENICPKCGATLRSSDKFCIGCGKKIIKKSEGKKVIQFPSLYFISNIIFSLILLTLLLLLDSHLLSYDVKGSIIEPMILVLYISWVIINIAFLIFFLVKPERRKLLIILLPLLSLASFPFLFLLLSFYYVDTNIVFIIVASVLVGYSAYLLVRRPARITEPQEKKNLCPKCGAKLRPNDRFCTECGKKIK